MAVQDEQINVKMTKKEKAEIKKNAEALNMDVTPYIRFVALNCKVTVTAKKGQS